MRGIIKRRWYLCQPYQDRKTCSKEGYHCRAHIGRHASSGTQKNTQSDFKSTSTIHFKKSTNDQMPVKCVGTAGTLQDLWEFSGITVASQHHCLCYPSLPSLYRQWGQSSKQELQQAGKTYKACPGAITANTAAALSSALPHPKAHPESCSQGHLSKCPLQPQTVGYPEYQQPPPSHNDHSQHPLQALPDSSLKYSRDSYLKLPQSSAVASGTPEVLHAESLRQCLLKHQPARHPEDPRHCTDTLADLPKHPTHTIYTEVILTQGHSLKTGRDSCFI